tara:strand:- start:556 stop:1245 length:690 start_codon:yes stop_codon:yes gene_type:complete
MNRFWENQSLKKTSFIHSLSNLSNDIEFSKEKRNYEMKKIRGLLKRINRTYNSCIEIGAGSCQWTYILAKLSKNVLCTDTSKGMLDVGKEYINKKKTKNNINFFYGDICEVRNPPNAPYDLVFISGLILYLSQNQFSKLIKFISINTKANSNLILREPVGINKEYVLDDVYSEELETNYSAIYRTENNILNAFKSYNYIVEHNDWLHPNNSKFNKWEETRLKLISLRRE